MISDPAVDPEKILIVNFTTSRADSDKACILQAGEHPFVHHETCVNYAGAKVVSKANLELLVHKGLMVTHGSVSAAILKRIREGAANSTRMSLDHADILINQGLINC